MLRQNIFPPPPDALRCIGFLRANSYLSVKFDRISSESKQIDYTQYRLQGHEENSPVAINTHRQI